MKKRKGIVFVAVLLAAAAAVCAAGFCYPVWRAAGLLAEKLDPRHCTYEIGIELDQENLPEENGKQLEILAKLTGVDESVQYRFTVKGSIWEDKVHTLVYAGEAGEPLAEFFMSDDMDVISVTATYEAMRKHLTEQYKVLYHLMPKQKEPVYMTVEQAEKLLGTDLGRAGEFALPLADMEFTRGKYFALLTAMSKEKGKEGSLFTLEAEHVQIYFQVTEGEEPFGEMNLRVNDPGEMSPEKERILGEMGIDIADAGFWPLKSLSITMSSRGAAEIAMPTNFVSQDMVKWISDIREWIQNIFQDEKENEIAGVL